MIRRIKKQLPQREDVGEKTVSHIVVLQVCDLILGMQGEQTLIASM